MNGFSYAKTFMNDLEKFQLIYDDSSTFLYQQDYVNQYCENHVWMIPRKSPINIWWHFYLFVLTRLCKSIAWKTLMNGFWEHSNLIYDKISVFFVLIIYAKL